MNGKGKEAIFVNSIFLLQPLCPQLPHCSRESSSLLLQIWGMQREGRISRSSLPPPSLHGSLCWITKASINGMTALHTTSCIFIGSGTGPKRKNAYMEKWLNNKGMINDRHFIPHLLDINQYIKLK